VQIVAAGTGRFVSFEDVLGAGALLSELPADEFTPTGDACLMARALYEANRHDLISAFARSVNGRRLGSAPELAPDVEFCTQRDRIAYPVFVEDHIARLGSPRERSLPPHGLT